MRIKVNGTEVPLSQGSELKQFATFGLGGSMVKTLTGQTELTTKGVRRINLTARVPFKEKTPDGGVRIADVSVGLTLNVASRAPFARSAELGNGGASTDPEIGFESKELAVARALQLVVAAISARGDSAINAPIQVDMGLCEEAHPLFRGSNGLPPLDGAAVDPIGSYVMP